MKWNGIVETIIHPQKVDFGSLIKRLEHDLQTIEVCV